MSTTLVLNLDEVKQEIKDLMISCETKEYFESLMGLRFGIKGEDMYVGWKEDRKIAVIFKHPWPKDGRVVVELVVGSYVAYQNSII